MRRLRLAVLLVAVGGMAAPAGVPAGSSGEQSTSAGLSQAAATAAGVTFTLQQATKNTWTGEWERYGVGKFTLTQNGKDIFGQWFWFGGGTLEGTIQADGSVVGTWKVAAGNPGNLIYTSGKIAWKPLLPDGKNFTGTSTYGPENRSWGGHCTGGACLSNRGEAAKSRMYSVAYDIYAANTTEVYDLLRAKGVAKGKGEDLGLRLSLRLSGMKPTGNPRVLVSQKRGELFTARVTQVEYNEDSFDPPTKAVELTFKVTRTERKASPRCKVGNVGRLYARRQGDESEVKLWCAGRDVTEHFLGDAERFFVRISMTPASR